MTELSSTENLSADISLSFTQFQGEPQKNDEAEFVCHICKKTFYNATALRNHKTTQHDDMDTSAEVKTGDPANVCGQIDEDIINFKFVPLKKQNDDVTNESDGLTRRTFRKDTSYLIIKYEDGENVGIKRSRLDSMIKRIQSKPTSKLVDLRGPFTCTYGQCGNIFFNCCEYSLHYREEHTKRRKAALRCQVCEKPLDRDVYSTLLSQRECAPTFNCRTCGCTFRDSQQFEEHNRMVHAKTKPHQCNICAKRFTQVGGLQQHMRMHSGIRPFVCKFCSKAFTQKAGLDQHLRTHTKVKPFKCIICYKCFSQSVHLRQHMRTHTNIQPFGCPICKRRFKQSSHLNFHMRSHIGVGNAFLLDQYSQGDQDQDGMQLMDFLTLSNVQPVQDGETMYYAAQLTPTSNRNFLGFNL